MTPALVLLISLGLIFDFLNGIHGSSNIVATVISTRALPPRWALFLTAIAEFAGPFLFGVAVANTIGGEIVLPGAVNLTAIQAALASAILWNLLTWILGFPSSSSHAIIGGLLGAVAVSAGWEAIRLAGLWKVLITLMVSPLVGFGVGFLVTRGLTWACWNAHPKVNRTFKIGQIATAIILSFSYGANDGQKTMGILTLGLVTAGFLDHFRVPVWVILACSGMIALGTLVGGWKLIRTLGTKFFRVRPMDGFAIQLSSALVILAASLFGGLVSTTHVVSTAILGVGSAERLNKVRWGVAQEIAVAWLLTIPCTAAVGAGVYWLIGRLT